MLFLPATVRATLLWDGNATNGLSVFKIIDIDGTNGSSVTAVSDPIYGTVWQFYKALNDHRCEAHGAAGINPAIGQTYYIGWRTKFVLPTQADLNAIFQWKAYGTPMLQNYPITIAPGGGALNLNQFNPSDAGGQTFLWSTPLVTNAWVSHVLAISVSTQDYGGYIEYWYNGAQQTFNTGTNQFWCRTFDGTSVDPKWGAYGGDIYTVYDYVSGLKIGTTYADVVDTLYAASATPPSRITGLTGTNITYTINVVTNPGFSGSISLSVSGLPTNTSFTLSPTSFTGPGVATLSVTTSNTTPPGTYTLLFRAVNGTQTNYTTVEMEVAKVPGTYVWNGPGAGAYNWSASTDWSPAGPPGAIDSVEFFNPGATGVSNVNNSVDSAFGGTISALQYGNTNNNHTTLIASGQTLTVVGGLTVGTETDNGSSQTVFATLTGPGGTLALNNPGFDWVVRQGTSPSGGSQRATLEMSGLGVVNAVVGRVLVGVPGPVIRATGTLYLGKTNTITTYGALPQICVGDNDANGGGANFLYLGRTNAIFADSITIGREKAAGTLAFNSRFSQPVAYFRAADGVSGVSVWNIGDASAQSTSSSTSNGTNDFSLGQVNALVGTMSVGLGQTATGANGSGVLTFSSGTINVNTLNLGVQSASGATSAGIGRVNVSGTNAALVVNSTVVLGLTSGGDGTANTYGVLNINGGTVLANTISAGAGSGPNSIAVNNGELVVTNTVGTTGLGINSVSLTNATLQFFVTAGQASVVATNLTTGAGASVVNIASLPAIGTYPAQFQLIQYAGSIAGAGFNFTLGALPWGAVVYGGYLSNNAAANSVDVVITNSTALVRVLTWDGGISTNWDTTTANWKTNTGPDTTYNQGDNVVFNDTASGSASINLTTALTPASVTASNNSKTYVFSGPGKISGSTGILKQGTNTLLLNTTNNFIGTIIVQGGVLKPGNTGALGVTNGITVVTNAGTLDINSISLGSEAVVVAGAGVTNGGAIVNSGAQQISALTNVTLSGDATFGGSGRWDIRGSPASLLSGGQPWKITKVGTNQVSLVAVNPIDAALGDIDIQQGTFAIQTSTTQVGDPNHTITVRSNAMLDLYNLASTPLNKQVVLQDGATVFNEKGPSAVVGPVTLQGLATFNTANSGAPPTLAFSNALNGAGSLNKIGPGTLVLTGTNTYTGATLVNTGVLALAGSGSISASTNIVVGPGATLDVSGRAGATLAVNSGQTLNGSGVVNGSLLVGANATVWPGAPGVAGVLTVTNGVTLQGTTCLGLNRTNTTGSMLQSGGSLQYGGTLSLANLGGAFAAGDSFTLFSAASYVGTFTNLVPTAPSPGLAWNTASLTNGTLAITRAPPCISSASLRGTNLVLLATNGATGGSCYVLAATNVALPLINWTRLATNQFDGLGSFAFTNGVNPGLLQQYYRLQLP